VERLREIYDDYFRRGVEWVSRHRGRNRRRPLIIVGVGAAVISVVLASVLWITDRTAPGEAPTAFEPANAVKDGSAVVKSKSAQLRSIVMVTPNRWAAGWAECPGSSACRYSAVLDREGEKSIAPEWPVPYAILRAGGEAIAVAPPQEGTLTGDPTLLFRQTYDGPLTSKLRLSAPTQTFQPGEILTDRIVPGRIVVVNLDQLTVRMLQTAGTRSPVCDLTGRCWVLTGVGRTEILWTDDGGKTWASAPLDQRNQRGRLAVSPDGQTLVATAVTIGSFESVASIKMSTDRGVHWTTVLHPPSRLTAAPVAFDDGTAALVGQSRAGGAPQLYRITNGSAQPDRVSPGSLTDLAGNDDLMYSPATGRRGTTQVAISTDHGTSWRPFQPR
jgi:hypothetical protein